MPAPALAYEYPAPEAGRRHPATYGEAANSEQIGSPKIDQLYLSVLRATASISTYIDLDQRAFALNDQLSALRNLDVNWDTYGAESPSEASISAASAVLKQLRGLATLPSAVRASAEGGVALCFTAGDKYAHLEFLNEGGVFALMYGPNDEAVSWSVEPDDALVETRNRIRAFLQP